ncbi:MAG: phosphate ABC transporter ATP-binding protein [Chloroflexi bacterium]|nr:phosphate ABC transporter ATP-binding protein [Chloroflexota bacterium]
MTSPRFQVLNLSLVRNGRPVLHDVNMCVNVGEIVCLLGPSGSGKSSLLRCLNRLTEPPPNTIFLNGHDITTLDVVALRHEVGMVFQKAALFPGTVANNIAYGPQLDGRPLSPTEMTELLALADLSPDYAQRPIGELSGGEAQRVSIARTLANHPDSLLLDEPTSALDPAGRRHVRETIEKLRQELGLTVIWVTHYMEEVLEVADRVYLLLDGRIADEGTPEHLLGPDSHHKTADFASGHLE